MPTTNFLPVLLLSLQGWTPLQGKANHSTIKKRRGRVRAVPGYRMSCSAMWRGQGAAVLTFPMEKKLRHAENRTILRKR